ncbi:hypothetical protein AAEX37_01404 [Oligella sp. MSHR50489EDL]|uniref:DNA methyltransferase n=1 Tax=Oligella sp. MSHR50489EDL TaxID=3139409 RepID=UPI003D812D84
MIYIDPPYNTGKDFVYKDNFRDNLANYLQLIKATDDDGNPMITNIETSGRFHSNWLNMMYPRLKLARNLLSNDGVIFISIDNKEHAQLKLICNEIFGEENFLGNIGWESKTKAQNTEDAFNKLQPKIEHIFVYAKTPLRRFNLVTTGIKNYDFEDEYGVYRWLEIQTMSAEGIRGRKTMIYPILGVIPEDGFQWKLGIETVQKAIDCDEVKIENGKPYIKMRPENERSEITSPFWGFFSKEMGTAENAKKELQKLLGPNGFETVKPIEIIKKRYLSR